MRILRTTFWKNPKEPTIAIVRECDAAFEDVRDMPIDDHLITYDEFEMEGEPTIEEATEAARLRIRERDLTERQMAVMYFYDVAQLPGVRGVMFMDKPSPLSVEDLRTVLEAVARHPVYEGQVRLAISNDMKLVRLADGKVTEEEL